MKKLIILCTVLLVLTGCKESEILIFDEKPEVRLTQSITEVRTNLLSSANGWIATLPTQAGGGYGFYMNFDANENVKMYADLNTNSIGTSMASTYRLKTVLGTELIFDTFNYISMLADPVPAVFGGAAGSGFKSDLEFLHLRSTADSMIFKGKKYGQTLAMVKATAAQKAAYEAGGYKTAIDKVNGFFIGIKNPYIETGGGAQLAKIGVSINTTNSLTLGKRIELSGLAPSGEVLAGTGKFAYTLNGIDLLGTGLLINGVKMVKVTFKDNATMAFYDDHGVEYVIKSNPTPLTPLAALFGFPTTFPYKRITIPNTGLVAGVNSEFTAVYNQMLALFISSGRAVVSTAFILSSNSTFTVEVNYTSGSSAFVASAAYTYTKVGDIITLGDNPIPNVNWPTRAAQIKPLADYMLTGPFKIDWVVSSNPAVTNIGGLYRTGNSNSFIYGQL
ncbi:DUF4302 domain-containing protein [Pedobacter insulae]|uniref:DUF4302 domain-containing protein n=1 Tax=Pedobacter insulae TaxID=414048 RepID=A0A1I2TM34_9SPHI|nr:DUF4302 domain-containing protein [Pedobacter insulae]SFG63516.1 protein of unknown function [Pedobacter insulae]